MAELHHTTRSATVHTIDPSPSGLGAPAFTSVLQPMRDALVRYDAHFAASKAFLAALNEPRCVGNARSLIEREWEAQTEVCDHLIEQVRAAVPADENERELRSVLMVRHFAYHAEWREVIRAATDALVQP